MIMEVEFALKNDGKTPALLTDIVAYLDVLPTYPDCVKVTTKGEYPPGLIIAAGELAPYLKTNRLITEAESNDIDAKKSLLLFLGVVKYDDVFGKPHETGFCWSGEGAPALVSRTPQPKS